MVIHPAVQTVRPPLHAIHPGNFCSWFGQAGRDTAHPDNHHYQEEGMRGVGLGCGVGQAVPADQ